MRVNLVHLRLLIRKNVWLQLRSPIWLFVEMLLPLSLILLYSLIKMDGIYPVDFRTDAGQVLKVTDVQTVLLHTKTSCCSAGELDRWMGHIQNSTGILFKRFDNHEEMKHELIRRKHKNDSSIRIGVEIEEFDLLQKNFRYSLLVEKNQLLNVTLEDRWGKHLNMYGMDGMDIYKVQYELDRGFLGLVGGTDHPAMMGRLPRPERIEMLSLVTFFYTLMPGVLLLSVVATTRNIVVERQTIKPYFSVMGLDSVTFHLSHCVVTLFKVLLLTLAMGIAAYWTFPGFPWALVTITLVLFSFSATAFSALLAAPFSSPSTAMQMCATTWLTQCIVPYFFRPDAEWGTVTAAVTSLWPTYALHHVFKFAVVVSNYGAEVGTWSGLTEAKWTGQMTLVPFLMLIVDTALMIGIVIVFEKGLLGRLIQRCRQKMRKSEKEAPQVELLSEADESFEVDEDQVDICLEDVFKEYPTGEKAVNGLSLKAHRGQVTVLLGHNGAGKTTTFSMICGVESSTAGTVDICGHPAGSQESRRMIGYCAQTNTLIGNMTVKDHIWLAHGLKQAEGHYWEEGEELLTTLGLIDHANKKVSSLSGGQKRKLCVAMALIGDSRVVLLDEPTAGMDPESRRDVEALLEEVKKERTILLTTHYMDEAETLGDRIFIVAAGQRVCSGSPQFLKKRFGTGYMLTLVAAENIDGPCLANKITPIIQEYAAGARLGEIRGKQVEIEVPVSEQKCFPALFERLESEQTALQISSFGLSLNSLEQVFLRVSNLTEDSGNSLNASEKELPLDEAIEGLYEQERHSGCKLYMGQLWAVLVKKFIYSLRFWSQLVSQIGVPLLSVAVGLSMYTLAEPAKEYFDTSVRAVTEKDAHYFMSNLMDSEEGKRFRRMLGDQGQTVDKGLDAGTFLRQNHDTKFYFGAIFGPNSTMLYPNPQYPISYATIVNTLSNTRLPSNGTISTSLRTFEIFDLEDSALIARQSLLMMLLLTICMCQFIVTIVEDRVSGFAHQQLLMGLPPLIYWLGDFLYCLVLFCLQNVVYIFSATFTGIVTPSTGVGLFFLLLLYYWATIPSVFVLSRYCNSSSRASLIHWAFLFGTFIAVAFYPAVITFVSKGSIVVDAQKWNLTEMTALELSHFLLGLFFPTAPMYQLIPAFATWNNGKAPEEEHPTLKARVVFYSCSLFVTGAGGLLFFLLVQLRHINYFFTRILRIPCTRRHIPEKEKRVTEECISEPEGQTMLETVDLCKVYGKNCALAHLDMSVKEKECFGLLGVSGAGKTTAFNIITGQMFATQGVATLDGTDCRKDLVLGFCPQFDAIHKDFTGREALVLLARIHGYPDPKETADEVLEIMGMTMHARKRMHRCSGGQRRRISVAASLLPRNSRIVILDEATAGIDPNARRDIWEVLSSLRDHSAILMTSHSMDECEALCSRIGILKKGGLAAVGTSQALKSRYGNFYTLTMSLPSSDMRAEVNLQVGEWFPGAVLKSDGFSLHLKWQIPKRPDDCWSAVFASCMELSEHLDVPDFCLTQSTLQDIFLLLAGENSSEVLKNAEEETTSQKGSLKSTSTLRMSQK